LEKRQPTSVLDIGIGYGKYGFLAREYGHAKIVDGVEAEKRYITPIQKSIYDSLYLVDITKELDVIARVYDLVLFIDCIEHMSKEEGHMVLQHFKCPIIVSTPAMSFGQVIKDYPFEEHKSEWVPEDFLDYPCERIVDPEGKALIVVINP